MKKEKILQFIKEYVPLFLISLLILFLTTYKFPYYIDATGGAINVSERVKIDNKYKSTGSFNMAYVNELPANALFLLIAKFNPKWDIVKQEDVLLDNETAEDNLNRNRILLSESTNNAIKIAYGAAGKEVTIKSSKLLVTFKTETAKTDIMVGDVILEVNDIKVKELDDVKSIVNACEVGDTVNFKIERDNKKINATAKVYEEDGEKFVGVGASVSSELKTDPELTLNFKKSESGPSGGLMTSLAIYDSLIQYDLTRGLKIVGTGTINADGTVGAIGGVKYKLNGAVKKNADLFFVPAGENYDEALKWKKKYNYDIKIVAISEFSDAVNYLMTLD